MEKEKRQYGLFEKQDGKWVRLHENLSFHKSVAIRIFQSALLAPHLNGIDGVNIQGIRELRVLK